MAARSSWKGFLKLSLVSVPVKAFTATPTQSGEVRLNQLHAGCNSRIKYQKVCPIHGEVSQDQIVSGYEFAKDQYVVVDPDELEKLRSEDAKAVSIQEFIPQDAIDPAYYSGATHYLVPDGPVGQKAFTVLYKGMLDQKRFGLAQMVWHGKERIVLLRPIEGLIAMSTLSYDQEITKPAAFADQVPKVEIAPEEMALSKMLIDAQTPKSFDFSQYKDTYTEKLTQLIEAKVAGKELVAPPSQEPAHIINLMDAAQAKRRQAARPGACRRGGVETGEENGAKQNEGAGGAQAKVVMTPHSAERNSDAETLKWSASLRIWFLLSCRCPLRISDAEVRLARSRPRSAWVMPLSEMRYFNVSKGSRFLAPAGQCSLSYVSTRMVSVSR